jgi:hypothetical protein
MPRTRTRKFKQSQQVIPGIGHQPAINKDYVIVRADDQLVLGFRAGHSPRQARMFFLEDYKKSFPRSLLPDVTAIEKTTYAPEAREHIRAGQTYEWEIPRS